MKHLFCGIIGILLCITSCTNDSPDDLIAVPADSQVTYNSNIKAIIDSQCLQCHNGPSANAGLRLENYSQVRNATENGAIIDRISRMSNQQGVMPLTGRMPQATIDLIINWSDTGYLEN